MAVEVIDDVGHGCAFCGKRAETRPICQECAGRLASWILKQPQCVLARHWRLDVTRGADAVLSPKGLYGTEIVGRSKPEEWDAKSGRWVPVVSRRLVHAHEREEFMASVAAARLPKGEREDALWYAAKAIQEAMRPDAEERAGGSHPAESAVVELALRVLFDVRLLRPVGMEALRDALYPG